MWDSDPAEAGRVGVDSQGNPTQQATIETQFVKIEAAKN
jgi:hypothetical protein